MRRKLDILIPTFNRPGRLHHLLKTGLALGVPEMSFVVLDDGSVAVEEVPGLGAATTEMVCRSFDSEHVLYSRNPNNMGVAASLARYYRDLCEAEYTAMCVDKDEFIDARPYVSALSKLDADPALSIVMLPLRQIDRVSADRPLLFDYRRMSGRDFIAHYVRDPTLQHAGAYAVLRVAAARKVGIPRSLDLSAHGLEDGFGIDIDTVLMVATTGDVAFEGEAPIRRSVIGGMTERYPLTFAYTYYQYAKRLMVELEARGFVSGATKRYYLAWWHLLIARGLVVAYRPVHGSEEERGVKRIRPHLTEPILLYLPGECVRLRVMPRAETVKIYLVGARLQLVNWCKKVCGFRHVD